jgi:hypothetical protein
VSESFSRGWSLILSITPGTDVLEVGADDGDRALALEAAGARVTCMRGTPEEAENLREAGFRATDQEAITSAPEEVDFDAVIISAALCRDSGTAWQTPDLDALLGMVAPRLRQGGSLVLALSNPLHSLPALAWLKSRLFGEASAPRRSTRAPRYAWPMNAAALRLKLEAAGLASVRVFAPLPQASRLKFLVPLEEPPALRYFFTHLAPRPHGLLPRLALGLASRLATLGLLARVVPEFEAVGVRPVAS